MTTTPAGYRLRVRPGELDAERFARLVEDGRRALAAGEPSTRRRCCARRWRCGAGRRSPSWRSSRSRRPRSRGWRSSGWPRSRRASRPTSPCGRHAALVGELQQLVAAQPDARAARRAADARALPLRAPGRGARGLPRRAARLVDGDRRRARPGAAAPAGGDPAPGRLARARRGRRRAAAGARRRRGAAARRARRRARLAAGALGARARRARAGSSRSSAPDGIGKTRLAAELAGEAHAAGRGRALRRRARARPRRRCRARRARAAATRPTLLVVDDADRAGADVPAELARPAGALAAVPVLVLATGGTATRSRARRRRRAHARAARRRRRPRDRRRATPGAGRRGRAGGGCSTASGGVPRRVHEVAGQWARREAARRVDAVAGTDRRRPRRAALDGGRAGRRRRRAPGGPRAGRPRRGDEDAAVVCPFKGLAVVRGRRRAVLLRPRAARRRARRAARRRAAARRRRTVGQRQVLRPARRPAARAGRRRAARQRGLDAGRHPAGRASAARAAPRPRPGADGPLRARGRPVRGDVHRLPRRGRARARSSPSSRGGDGDAGRDRRARGPRRLLRALRGVPELVERCSPPTTCSSGAMRRDELRRAVERPAPRVGLRVEPELADALVADVEHEPGALPLLSTALLELWQRRDGRRLRLAHLRARPAACAARSRGSPRTRSARSTPRSRPSRAACSCGWRRTTARAVRRAPARPARRAGRATADVARVVALLTDRRLLTVSAGTVELAHEALLREWPRLRGWLEEDAEGRRLHRHLTDAAREWDERGRDAGDAVPRRAARRRRSSGAPGTTPELNHAEREFLDAAERELDAARARRRRVLALGVGLLVVVIAGSRPSWRSAASSAPASRSAPPRRATSPSRRASTHSARTSGWPRCSGSRPTAASRPSRPAAPSSPPCPPGRLSADRRAARRTACGRGRGDQPRRRTLASATDDGTIWLWDVATRRRARPRRSRATPERCTTSRSAPTGRSWPAPARTGGCGCGTCAPAARPGARSGAAPARAERRVQPRRHDARHRRQPWPRLDRTRSCERLSTVRLWDVATRRDAPLAVHFAGAGGLRRRLPSRRHRARHRRHGRHVRAVDVATGRRRPTAPPAPGVGRRVEFSPDGRTLASGADDFEVPAVGDRAGRSVGRPLGTGVSALAFSPDGATLASGSRDETVRLWSTASRRSRGRARSRRRSSADRGARRHRDALAAWPSAPDGAILASAGDQAGPSVGHAAAHSARPAAGRGMRAGCAGWRSRRAARWRRVAWTGRCGCGTPAPERRRGARWSIRAWCSGWRRAVTGARWPRPVRTGRCGCGTRRAARRWGGR